MILLICSSISDNGISIIILLLSCLFHFVFSVYHVLVRLLDDIGVIIININNFRFTVCKCFNCIVLECALYNATNCLDSISWSACFVYNWTMSHGFHWGKVQFEHNIRVQLSKITIQLHFMWPNWMWNIHYIKWSAFIKSNKWV